MFRNINDNRVLEDVKHFLGSSNLQSEPYMTTFRKYLGEVAVHNNDDSDFLVHATNSLGIQTRNDVPFRLQTIQSEVDCPVLKTEHIKNFKNMDDLKTKLKELPNEWSILQITSAFSPKHITSANTKNQLINKPMYIARFSCGNLVDRCPPYVVTVDPTGEDSISEPILKMWSTRRQAYHNWNDQKLRMEFKNTDSFLSSYFNEVENHWLVTWKCLLTGRIEDAALEADTLDRIRDIIKEFIKKQDIVTELSREAEDMLYLLALSAHGMKNKDMMKVIRHALGPAGTDVSNSDVFAILEGLKMVNLRNSCAVKRSSKHPVVLILDRDYEMAPWEMFGNLSGQPVVRILSLHLLYALYKHHNRDIRDGYRLVPLNDMFCLINPGKDLKTSEEKLTDFMSNKLPWVHLEVGKAPDPHSLMNLIQDCRVYMYCGHGSGSQYIHSSNLRKTCVNSLVFLYGCSSNLPQSLGGRTPYHNDTYTYLLNGAPSVVGCLYDIVSSDADIVCLETMSRLLPTVTRDGAAVTINNVVEDNVLKALNKGKEATKFMWSRCSFVVRGLPCRMYLTDESKLQLLRKVHSR